MVSREEGSNSEVTSKSEAIHNGNTNTTQGILLPITCHKLNGQNYTQCTQFVRIYMYRKGKEEYLMGVVVQPKKMIQDIEPGN